MPTPLDTNDVVEDSGDEFMPKPMSICESHETCMSQFTAIHLKVDGVVADCKAVKDLATGGDNPKRGFIVMIDRLEQNQGIMLRQQAEVLSELRATRDEAIKQAERIKVLEEERKARANITTGLILAMLGTIGATLWGLITGRK